MLTEIHSCLRKSHEASPHFANSSDKTVARYAVHSEELDTGMDRQFAVLMFRDAKLTVDTMNAFTFKFTAMKNRMNRKTEKSTYRCTF